MEKYDLIVIGTGAAGLSAGVYAGRYNMKTLVVGKEFGGETAKAGSIENWPGDISVDGYELMSRMKKHAEHVGAKVIDGEVKKVEKDGDCFNVTIDDTTYHAGSIVLGLGSERRRLGLPNEKELTGKGVHFCVTCDGPIYSGRTIALVGGGDAAVKGVNLIAEYVEKIFLLVRGKEFRAEPINVTEMKKLGDKVEVLYETEVKEIVPNEKGLFEKVILTKEYNGSTDLNVDGLFIEVGAVPNTDIVEPLHLKHDATKYLEVDSMMRTSEPGVYAAGDIVNHFEHFKQDITASAMGAVAATSAYGYYKEHKGTCEHAD